MGVEFEDNRARVKDAINSAIIAFLYEAGGELQAKTMRNSRVDTGQTKGSYEYKVNEANGECQIGSNLENAIWEEFGTGEYALHGDGRKGGWYYVDRHGKGHFTRGKTPNRPMHNAFTSLKSKLIRRFEQVLQSRMGG